MFVHAGNSSRQLVFEAFDDASQPFNGTVSGHDRSLVHRPLQRPATTNPIQDQPLWLGCVVVSCKYAPSTSWNSFLHSGEMPRTLVLWMFVDWCAVSGTAKRTSKAERITWVPQMGIWQLVITSFIVAIAKLLSACYFYTNNHKKLFCVPLDNPTTLLLFKWIPSLIFSSLCQSTQVGI